MGATPKKIITLIYIIISPWLSYCIAGSDARRRNAEGGFGSRQAHSRTGMSCARSPQSMPRLDTGELS
jgi:hypothetical protein